MTATINYGETRIDGLKIIDVEPKKGRVLRMSVNDQVVEPTDRFWTSLCANYSNQGLSTKLFNMFSHAEVFERLSYNQKKSRIRFTLEDTGSGLPRLLGVSNPAKPYVDYKNQLDILDSYEAENVVYNGGMVQSTHTPTRMPSFKIGPDEFEYKFVMETPIDGYGLPSVYLSLLRYVCTNGAIGYARAFKSQIKLGSKEDNITHVIRRTLEGYSNEEGFQALRDRWESASKSYVSLGECNKIWNTLHKMSQSAMFLDEKDLDPSKARIVESCRKRYEAVHPGSENSELMSSRLMRAYEGLTGDVCSKYGLVHRDAVSRKQMSRMPLEPVTVYDLLNFTSEMATHYTKPGHARLLHAEIGNLLTDTYDLEGTVEAQSEFQDLFVSNN